MLDADTFVGARDCARQAPAGILGAAPIARGALTNVSVRLPEDANP
jgi:hypothetical protein